MLSFSHLANKFKNTSRAEKALIVASTVFLVGFAAWAGYQFGYQKIIAPDTAKNPKGTQLTGKVEDPKIANPITGVLFPKEEADQIFTRVPLGVMIENSTVARPQRGLSKADIVYEALAEGDITRFLAVFLSQSSQIGPIRSAREYYFDWLTEYRGAYAHWGGNEYVRALAGRIFGKKDLDQFAIGGPTFYRIPPGSRSEHSGHSTTDRLWEVATKRGVNNKSSFESWKFKDDQPLNPPSHGIINIGLKGKYSVRWEFDAASNSYKRFNGGVAHMDREHNVQLSAKNVVVIFMQNLGYKQVTPGVSNRNFVTIGSGAAKIFRDGTLVDGSWKKDSREARTKLFDANGVEIELNRGQIWMEMLPVGTSVT